MLELSFMELELENEHNALIYYQNLLRWIMLREHIVSDIVIDLELKR